MKLLSTIFFLVTLFFLEPAAAAYYNNSYQYQSNSPRDVIRNFLDRPRGYRYAHNRRRHHLRRQISGRRYVKVRWNKTDRRLMRLSYALRLFLNYKRTHPHRYREHKMAYRALAPVLQASYRMYLPPLRHYRQYRRMHKMSYRLMSRRRHRYHYDQMGAHHGYHHGYNNEFDGMMYRPKYYRRYHHYRPRWSRWNRRNSNNWNQY